MRLQQAVVGTTPSPGTPAAIARALAFRHAKEREPPHSLRSPRAPTLPPQISQYQIDRRRLALGARAPRRPATLCRPGRCFAARPPRGASLRGEGTRRSGLAPFLLQRAKRRRGPSRRCRLGAAPAHLQVALGFPTHRGRDLALLRRREVHARSARLRETYRDGLLGGTGPVFAATNVLHLLANEFAGGGTGRAPFSRCFVRTPNRLVLGHVNPSSPDH